MNIHNTDAAQLDNLEPEGGAHPPDLAILPFGKNDTEYTVALLRHLARKRHAAQYADTLAHAFQELGCNRTIDRNDVLLLMSAFRPQNPVHNISVIRKQD
ncbi:hypothetical protein D3C85_1602630 [compost metagenome]